MGNVLSSLDWTIFLGSLAAIMGLGLWAGWKEDTSEDYYLAGKTTRWWGVAGSVFGSNVSANHIVGMMGVGYAFGFAQSHFEITAIVGLLALCYLFLPVYRKLNIYTLSEYLGRRYDDRSRVIYALLMVTIMVIIQMVPGFYIGSRAFNKLLNTDEVATAKAVVENGAVTSIEVIRSGSGYVSEPVVAIQSEKSPTVAKAVAAIKDGQVTSIKLESGGSGYDAETVSVTLTGGADFDTEAKIYSPGDVNPVYYVYGILLMAFVTGTYTILGGLKAVIVTDVIQSVLVLIAGVIVAVVTYSALAGNDVSIASAWAGWQKMVAQDLASDSPRLNLYNPVDHPGLPWTGVLSGLMVLHFFYWGANQFIVQRALSAKSDGDARMGIISAGFFKLLIPFFSIGCGIAAFYYYNGKNELGIPQDIVFIKLLTDLVVPMGFGLAGLVAAGVVGAILSSLDSMMNSAATIVTYDIYKRYIAPEASEKTLINVGRLCIVLSIVLAAVLTIFSMDPNSKDSFFLQIASYQGRLVAGVVVVFLVGMLWKRATANGAFVALIVGIIMSFAIPWVYPYVADPDHGKTVASAAETTDEASTDEETTPDSGDDSEATVTTEPKEKEHTFLYRTFGPKLNFFHTAALAAFFALITHLAVSLLEHPTEEQKAMTWAGLGVFTAEGISAGIATAIITLGVYATLAAGMVFASWAPGTCGLIAAGWTWAIFIIAAIRSQQAGKAPVTFGSILKDDRLWGGLLGACAVFMMYYFYLPN